MNLRLVSDAADTPASREGSENGIAFLLKSVQHALRQTIDDAARRMNLPLNFPQFVALTELHQQPGSTGAQLARRAFVSAQTMNAVLLQLEPRGLIERGPHPDSLRAYSWRLTDNGRDLLDRANIMCTSVFSQMLAALDETETTNLESYLQRCLAALNTRSDRR